MNRPARVLVTSAVALVALVGAWRIGSDAMATRSAARDPSGALRWRANDPGAVVVQARARSGRPAEAETAARRLLANEPLRGDAFAVVADAAVDPMIATALHRIAVRRAPRRIAPRVWLINDALRASRFDEAMQNIDVLLRLSPPYRAYLYPRLAELALDPAFADALIRRLRSAPMWRAEFVQTLQATHDPAPGARFLAALADRGGLDADERRFWIDGLLAQGRRGEAYARWAGSLHRDGEMLPAVYNGGFAHPPTGTGFDWHLGDSTGVELDFVGSPGPRGQTAHAVFRGRPSAGIGLEHPLVLAPGRYRLVARMRAQALQGEVGLAWSLSCDGGAQDLQTGAPVEGSFDWHAVALDFDVPRADCGGQWLRLVNLAPPGAAQHLSGEVWFDDVQITAMSAPGQALVATLRAPSGAALRSRGADFVDAKPGARLADGDRLLLVADATAQIVFDSGCVQGLSRPDIYAIDAASCTTEPTLPAGVARGAPRRAVPPIEILPEAEAWKVLPIGR